MRQDKVTAILELLNERCAIVGETIGFGIWLSIAAKNG